MSFGDLSKVNARRATKGNTAAKEGSLPTSAENRCRVESSVNLRNCNAREKSSGTMKNLSRNDVLEQQLNPIALIIDSRISTLA